MAIHSNKYNKASQNEEQQSVKMSSKPRNVSGMRPGSDGVQSELNRMNANLEKMCGCFYRLMHDRGKDLDQNSNGSGFREDFEHGVGHRELLLDGEMVVQSQIEKWNRGIGSNFEQIESKTFDRMVNQKWCSAPTAMDSSDRDLVITIGNVQYPITEEVLHQIFDSFGRFEIIDLFSLKNGDVQAHIGFRCFSSAALAKYSLQGRSIYAGCCHMEIEFYKQQQGKIKVLTNGDFRGFRELDHGFNGDFRGFRELDDVGNHEVIFDGEIGAQDQIEESNGGIGSNFRRIESSFDLTVNRNWCSAPTISSDQIRETPIAMDSDDRDLVIIIKDILYPITEEVLHQIFDSFGSFEIFDLFSLKNGDVQAQIRFLCSSSAECAKLSLQGRCIYTGCCQMEIEFYKQQQVVENVDRMNTGMMDQIVVTGFQGALDKPEVQLSGHADFGEYTAVVETEDVVVEVEVILVDEELGNASNGMNCGADNAIVGAEVGTDCTIVASVVTAGERDAPECVGESGSATGKMNLIRQPLHILSPGAESYTASFIPNIEVPKEEHSAGNEPNELGWDDKNLDWKPVESKHIRVKLISMDFEDPFDVPPNSVLIHLKFQLMLAVGIDISMVEVKGWLAFECECVVCRLALGSQGMCTAAGIGAQWLRLGVG